MSSFQRRLPLIVNRVRPHTKHVVVLLALLVLIAGCSGFTPMELRNEREEGPQKGLFSGSSGEFVIFRYTPPEKGPEKKEDPAQTEE